MEVEITESQSSRLDEYVALYGVCFPKAVKLQRDYLSWQYFGNPDGHAVGADAICDGKVVGQVIAIPGTYMLKGRPARGLVAVNVAVHPSFQGKHLFKKLGLKMCEYGAQKGYEFVIGIANAVATPGWTRQMKFKLLGPLSAMVGFGPLYRRACERAAASAELSRVWTRESLAWRLANPVNRARASITNDGAMIVSAATGTVGLRATAVLPSALHDGLPATGTSWLPHLNVFLGSLPGYHFGATYFAVPDRAKPSPLNLVYKNLIDPVGQLSLDQCFITFLDFDAF